jgi:hypothetical protein
MRIEGMDSVSILENRRKKPGPVAKSVITSRDSDTYVPSNMNVRTLALESIKAKVKSGYYNSEKIAEDISDKLAKYLDED